MPANRRRFLRALAASLSAPALLLSAKSSAPLPICFSTLGCPRWDWSTILEHATEWGYAAIELRGLQGEMDLTKRPEFAGGRRSATLRELESLGLRIVNLGSSARLHEAVAATRAAQIDEARRFIDLAHQLRAPFIRVFGDRFVPGASREATLARVVSGLRDLGDHAKGSGVTVLLESHGDFCDSPVLSRILAGAELPTVGLLWDAHHTVVTGKEAPAETLRQLGRHIRHVHLKDSKPEGEGVRYVLTGAGTIPLREITRQLVAHRYGGYYSLEWEKAWHPEIEEPEVAFPQFSKTMKEYLEAAAYKPV